MIAHIKHSHPWKISFNKQLFQKLIWVPPEAIARMCSTKTFTKFTKLTRKYLCWSLFLNRVAGLQHATLLQKRLRHRYFPAKVIKFIRTFCRTSVDGCFRSSLPEVFCKIGALRNFCKIHRKTLQ